MVALNETYLFDVDLQMHNQQLQNFSFLQIEELLQKNKKSLKDFPCMSFPKGVIIP